MSLAQENVFHGKRRKSEVYSVRAQGHRVTVLGKQVI